MTTKPQLELFPEPVRPPEPVREIAPGKVIAWRERGLGGDFSKWRHYTGAFQWGSLTPGIGACAQAIILTSNEEKPHDIGWHRNISYGAIEWDKSEVTKGE